MSVEIISTRTSPIRESQLEIGALYRIDGAGETVDRLPAQVFRLESKAHNYATGTTLLIGTLWWRVWVAGRPFGGTQHTHHIAVHQVGIGVGSRLSSRHDFHFERVGRHDVARILGEGRAYQDFVADERRRRLRMRTQRRIVGA